MKYSKSSDKLVSVIIVTKDRGNQLKECINSFVKNSYTPLEIIVVDNASNVPVEKMLKTKYKNIILVRNNENKGAAEGRNIGINVAKGKYLLFSDDDAVASVNMVSELVNVFKKYENAGIVQPLIYDKQNKKLFQGAGHNIDLLTGRIKPFGINVWGQSEKDMGQYSGIREVPMCGCVWMVKRKVFEKIGNYDPEYFIPYEDSDFSVRAKKAGFKLYCTSKAISFHPTAKKSDLGTLIQFLGVNSPERAYRLSRNKIIFMKKHSPFPKNILFFLIFLPILTLIHTAMILLSRNIKVLFYYWYGVISGLDYLIIKQSSFKTKTIVLLVVTSLFSFIALKSSFDLSLFGDDWLIFFDLKNSMGPGKSLDYTSFNGYFGPYTYPHYFMQLVSMVFGFDAKFYYLVSAFFRVLAIMGISSLVYFMSKNFWSSVITSLLFSVSVVGLETTNWVFNATSYLSVFFLSISLYKIQLSEKRFSNFLYSLFFLMLSIMMFPQRMHGAIPFFIGFYFLLVIFVWRKIKISYILPRIALIILLFFFLLSKQTFGALSEADWFKGELKKDYTIYGVLMINSIFPTYSNLIIPDNIYETKFSQKIIGTLVGGSALTPRFKPYLFLHIILTAIFASLLKNNRRKFVLISSLFVGIWVIIAKTMVGSPQTYFKSYQAIASTFLGVSLLSWFMGYLLVSIKSKHILKIYLILFWPVLLIIIPWSRSHFQPLPSYFRYMVVAGVGMPMLFGFLFDIAYSKIIKTMVVAAFLLVFYLQLNSSIKYLGRMKTIRNEINNTKIWNQLVSELKRQDYIPTEKYTVVYFKGDYENLYHNISFGFSPRFALIFDISDPERNKIPIAVDRPEDLLRLYDQRDINGLDFERFYAFEVVGNQLTDIKSETRSRLLMENSEERL
ncbi:MAG: hypothetical protein US62_C0029G0016 [Candidatus Woesebacteria bacterium GW2011_GWA1_37_8]|uniref:Glycosyltransferase 2-like domain-containing protein n=1 Tax=Candidatus Woesebacteria bacterium GW2011_GWA1_37_8 TaxID=1618546 RepID=A0A0G0I027_9BACT|nr:MAG: hypothetical protein US39_C0004G0059 [Microgenomates group bacterium GW2011_GWC1_37_12b]KKQ44260.1 MAG: hypothetical protein US62_C0029G0016 [Candidatus Woesebacteria bacterium GW2011_GWA1_37_8]